MGIPYAFVRALKGEKPYLDKESRLPKQQAEFLVQEGNMRGKYLGVCLDSCRWGSQTTVMYEMDINGLIGFIENWMHQNAGNFQDLWHERQINELYKTFELPFIRNETCSVDSNHNDVILDRKGRLRCAHKSEKKFKPNFVVPYMFFDRMSATRKINFFQAQPQNLPDCAWDKETGDLSPEYREEMNIYLRKLDEFEQEEPNFLVTDVCYAILSDDGTILSLETILKRLNLRPDQDRVYCGGVWGGNGIWDGCELVDELSREEKALYETIKRCPGHTRPHGKTEFSFDGWYLAFYVQKWHQQLSGQEPPIFEK